MNKLDGSPQFLLDSPLINIGSTNIFSSDGSSYIPVVPVIGDFLLLDGTSMLLLDGTHFLLL